MQLHINEKISLKNSDLVLICLLLSCILNYSNYVVLLTFFFRNATFRQPSGAFLFISLDVS